MNADEATQERNAIAEYLDQWAESYRCVRCDTVAFTFTEPDVDHHFLAAVEREEEVHISHVSAYTPGRLVVRVEMGFIDVADYRTERVADVDPDREPRTYAECAGIDAE
jgi:hypothetical protein